MQFVSEQERAEEVHNNTLGQLINKVYNDETVSAKSIANVLYKLVSHKYIYTDYQWVDLLGSSNPALQLRKEINSTVKNEFLARFEFLERVNLFMSLNKTGLKDQVMRESKNLFSDYHLVWHLMLSLYCLERKGVFVLF